MESGVCDSCEGVGARAFTTALHYHAAPIGQQTMPSTQAERTSRKRAAESDPEEDGGEEGEGENEEAAAVQPGQELGAPSEEGGGIEDAILSRLEEDNDNFTYDVTEDALCNVSQIVFLRDEEEVVFNRPDRDTDEWMLWRQMEKGRLALKKVKQMATEFAQVASIVKKYQPGEAPKPTVGLRAVPAPVQWQLKPLPSRIAGSIEGRYFFELVETIADKHGRPYVPRDQSTGTMCATTGFPHAYAWQKEKGRGKGAAALQYVVAACNTVQLTVRLMKRIASDVPGEQLSEPVSEAELLEMLKSAHKPAEMESWGTYENNMVMYAGLEFNDGNAGEFTPVPAAAFTQPPSFNALFSPPESPPYLGGTTEWNMAKGVAIFKTKMARCVTSTNLKPDHKKREFRFVVKTLNPFFCALPDFTVRSRGFCLKGVLHNDAKSGDRFVQGENGIVSSPASDAP